MSKRRLINWRRWKRIKAKLEKLLALRLRHVKPQYVEDVRSRKQTIIDGTGLVHEVMRFLEKEYCYQGVSPVSLDSKRNET